MRIPAHSLFAIAACCALGAHAGGSPEGASVGQAAAYYHRGLFDTALVRLEALKDQGPWKRRDSLALFQYMGMASARLGRDSQAVACFGALLELDSLFQFPRNEDGQILLAFTRAKELRSAHAPGLPAPLAALAPASPTPPLPAPENAGTAQTIATPITPVPDAPGHAGRISMIDSGAAAGGRPRREPNVGIAMGALPFGAGWMARKKVRHGLVLGLLQAGSLALSVYASEVQSKGENDPFRVEDENERSSLRGWQWVQRVSLSTAVGAYLFSLIASAGD
jgi:hypothetical protein